MLMILEIFHRDICFQNVIMVIIFYPFKKPLFFFQVIRKDLYYFLFIIYYLLLKYLYKYKK